MSLLELTNVTSGYAGKEILTSLSFSIERPAIYVVLGPNGAGKTTLFRTVAGILKPLSGDVKLDGKDLYSENRLREQIGYLSHYSALPEEMTVGRALGFYADIEGGNTQKAIDTLELRDLALKKVGDLSQGQKKRASIAKLFLRERMVYLLDEPTSNLDPVVAREVRDILLELSRARFVLYSSHNLYEAQEIGDYIILIKNGRVAFFGGKEELRARGYTIAIRSPQDVSKVLPSATKVKGYYNVWVSGPEEVGGIIAKLVQEGMPIYEVKEAGNPLEDLFTAG